MALSELESLELEKLQREQTRRQSNPAVAEQPKQIIPDMTEQQKISNPTLAGLNQTARDVTTAGYKGVNGLSLGILGNVLKSKGIQEPNFDNTAPENKSGLNLIGDVANLGGAGKTLGVIGSKIGDISNATGLTNLISTGTNKTTGVVKRIIDSFKGASATDLEAKLAQRRVEIATEKLNLEGLFKQKYKDITIKGKQVVPQISQGMSKAYEQGLDDIFTKLDDPLLAGGILKKNAPAITNQELVTNLESLVNRVQKNPLIIESDAYKKTVKMLDEFKNGLKSEAGLVDGATGRVLNTGTKEAVDIKDLISRVREIKATITSSTTNGTAPVTGRDYFATQFDKTIGGLLKDRVNGFSELQASYAPMANTRKVAYKIFKPLSDEDSTLAFLNRVKNDTLRSSDEKLLKFLQDGGVVAGKKIPGMGEFAPELKNIGSTLKKLNSGLEEKQLAADIFKKASDEKFRNRFFIWTLGGIGLSQGAKKAAEVVITHH